MNTLRPFAAATKVLLVLTLLLGVVYPFAMTGLARITPGRADGSLITVDGTAVGSALLGQQVDNPAFFQPRPSASDYVGDVSGGSNMNASNPDLIALVAQREAALRTANPDAKGRVPADALTASSSGLDPDISPEYAAWQAPRVAKASGVPRQQVDALIARHTTQRALGIIGNPHVNVTELNLDLARAVDGRG